MCSDKSYEESAYCKFNYHYQPIPVSSNVEYVMLITYVVSIRKVSYYVFDSDLLSSVQISLSFLFCRIR